MTMKLEIIAMHRSESSFSGIPN